MIYDWFSFFYKTIRIKTLKEIFITKNSVQLSYRLWQDSIKLFLNSVKKGRKLITTVESESEVEEVVVKRTCWNNEECWSKIKWTTKPY